MKTTDVVRWENLLVLIKEVGGDEKLSEIYNCTAGYIRQLKLRSVDSETGKPKAIGSRTARSLEQKTNKPRGWMDVDHSSADTHLHEKESYDVPLISWVAAGGFTEVTDWLADEEVKITTTYKARKHTFALIVDGQSMQPKFPSGCTIIVEPEEKAVNGSYVVVRQNGDQEATFKQLVIEGGVTYLKALNPEWPKRIIEMMPDAVIIGVVKQMVMDI
jgi:SOS-response transcriptional repressor LexA